MSRLGRVRLSLVGVVGLRVSELVGVGLSLVGVGFSQLVKVGPSLVGGGLVGVGLSPVGVRGMRASELVKVGLMVSGRKVSLVGGLRVGGLRTSKVGLSLVGLLRVGDPMVRRGDVLNLVGVLRVRELPLIPRVGRVACEQADTVYVTDLFQAMCMVRTRGGESAAYSGSQGRCDKRDRQELHHSDYVQ